MKTRVVFADGDADVQFWPVTPCPSPAANLLTAIIDAEYTHGLVPHAGAWLEFTGDAG